MVSSTVVFLVILLLRILPMTVSRAKTTYYTHVPVPRGEVMASRKLDVATILVRFYTVNEPIEVHILERRSAGMDA